MGIFKWLKKKKLTIAEQEAILLTGIGEAKFKEYLSYKEELRKEFVIVEQTRISVDGSYTWKFYYIKREGEYLFSFTNRMGDMSYYEISWDTEEAAKAYIERTIFWQARQRTAWSMETSKEITT